MARIGKTLFAAGAIAVAAGSSFVGCSSSTRNLGIGAHGGTSGAGGDAGADASSGDSGAGVDGPHEGGTPDDGGAGGDFSVAGMGPAPEACVVNDDCDDALACNGVETCVDGACKEGHPLCVSADADHCEVLCSEGASGAVCGAAQGKDADKDGHLSAACKAAPGDDCDDTNAKIHPGASESCDGFDNDCNGKSDLGDGLQVSGTTEVLWSNAKTSSIAYSPTDNVYGVALSRGTGPAGADPYNTALFVIGANNKPTITAVPLTSITSGYSGPTAITWGGTEFGIAYGDGSDGVKFRRAGADGLVHPQVDVSTLTSSLVSLSIARVPNGNWGIVWHEAFQSYHGVRGRTVNGADLVSGEFAIGSNGVGGQIAVLSGGFGAAFTVSSPATGSSVSLDNRSASFAPVKAQTLSTGAAANHAVVASNGAVFGVAWLDGANVVFRTMTDAGAAGCAPVTVAANGFIPGDIVSTGRGFLIVSGATKIEAQEVSNACVFGQRFTIDPDTAQTPHIAGGAKGFALAWDDNKFSAALKGVQTRTFGPQLLRLSAERDPA